MSIIWIGDNGVEQFEVQNYNETPTLKITTLIQMRKCE